MLLVSIVPVFLITCPSLLTALAQHTALGYCLMNQVNLCLLKCLWTAAAELHNLIALRDVQTTVLKHWLFLYQYTNSVDNYRLTLPFSTRLVTITIRPLCSCHTIRHMSWIVHLLQPAHTHTPADPWIQCDQLLQTSLLQWWLLVLPRVPLWLPPPPSITFTFHWLAFSSRLTSLS